MSHNGVATSGARPAGVPRLALNRVGTGSAGAFGSTSASARSAASAARVPQPPTHSSSARRGGFRNSARRTNHAGTASARVPHSYTVRSRSQSPRSARGAATSSGSAVVKIRAPLIDVPSKAFRRMRTAPDVVNPGSGDGDIAAVAGVTGGAVATARHLRASHQRRGRDAWGTPRGQRGATSGTASSRAKRSARSASPRPTARAGAATRGDLLGPATMSERIGAHYSLAVGKLSPRLMTEYRRVRAGAAPRSGTAYMIPVAHSGGGGATSTSTSSARHANGHAASNTSAHIMDWIQSPRTGLGSETARLVQPSLPDGEALPWRPLLPASTEDVAYIMHVDGGGPAPDGGARLDANEEFLVLDNSDMPLEMFDNSTFEMHTPEEWIALGQGVFIGEYEGTPASAPAYRNGEWVWVTCVVTKYDSAAQRYTVVFPDTGKSKQVKRLNLHFAAEPDSTFWGRRKWCEDAREAAKAATRYEHYLSKQPGDLRVIAPLPEAWERQILQWAVNGGTTSGGDVRERLSLHSASLAAMLEEVRASYTLAMKHAAIGYNTLNPRLRAGFQRLKLPLPHRNPPPPYKGMVCAVDDCDAFGDPVARYTTLRDAIAAITAVGNKEIEDGVHEATSSLLATFNAEFSVRRFTDTRIRSLREHDELETEEARHARRRRKAIRNRVTKLLEGEKGKGGVGDQDDVALDAEVPLPLPCSLDTWNKRQKLVTTNLATDLDTVRTLCVCLSWLACEALTLCLAVNTQSWRKAFVAALYDALQNSYNLYERDVSMFRQSVLSRLLRRVHYVMADQLRVLTRFSIVDFVRFVAQLCGDRRSRNATLRRFRHVAEPDLESPEVLEGFLDRVEFRGPVTSEVRPDSREDGPMTPRALGLDGGGVAPSFWGAWGDGEAEPTPEELAEDEELLRTAGAGGGVPRPLKHVKQPLYVVPVAVAVAVWLCGCVAVWLSGLTRSLWRCTASSCSCLPAKAASRCAPTPTKSSTHCAVLLGASHAPCPS